MKRIIILIALSFGLVTISNAKTWQIAPNVNSPGYLKSLQNANDTSIVSVGDTVFLPGIGGRYPDANINKKLIIIGSGYYLGANQGLTTQTTETTVGKIAFQQGSAGSVLMSLQPSRVVIKESQISIIRVRYTEINISPNGYYIRNILIAQCFDFWINDDANANNPSSGIDGITIQNCVMNNIHLYNQNHCSTCPNLSNLIIDHCFFDARYCSIDNARITNSIFGMSARPGSGITNCSLNKNAILDFPGASITNGASSGNSEIATINTTNSNNYSITPALPGPGSDNWAFALTNGASIKNAALDGTDIGPTGGTDPLKPSGIPNLPSIYRLTVPTYSNGNILPVTIGTRTNN